MPSEELAQTLAQRYAEIPQVLAVALAGSRTAGKRDAHSDIDLYVYGREDIPVEPREAIARRRADRWEVDNRFWESGDEWFEREGGTHVDVMFRSTDFVEDYLDRLLIRHEARLGYTTAVWHNLRTSQILFDRAGWLGQLQEKAAAPYPDELARAIIAKNVPLLRGAIGAYPRQIELAVKRADLVAVNHRAAELLASFFDVLFALNRAPHPGEKRLLVYAGALPRVPRDLSARIEALLSFNPTTLQQVPGHVDALVNDLEELLVRAGQLPGPHGVAPV